MKVALTIMAIALIFVIIWIVYQMSSNKSATKSVMTSSPGTAVNPTTTTSSQPAYDACIAGYIPGIISAAAQCAPLLGK